MESENKKILMLVEDEMIIAIGKKMELEKYGYNVIHANTGEKAVTLSTENKEIDLILMDIDLGKGIDGTEAAALIIKEKDIPVVFLSSHMEPEVVGKTERITSYGYVVKSSSITVLDASIKMAFKLFDAQKEINKQNMLIKGGNENLRVTIEELEKGRNRLTSIFRVAPIGIGVVTDRILVEINQRICEMTGYQNEELIGRTSRILYQTQEDFDSVGIEKYEQIKLKGTGTVETRWKCKDGKIIDVLLSSTPLDTNDLGKGVTFTALDITEHKLIKKIEEETTSNLNSLINNRKESIWSIDRNYNYIILNDFFKDVYKRAFNVELRTGINSLKILPPELLEIWKPKYDEALSGKEVVFEHTTLIDNKLHFYEISLNPIITNNEVTGATALSIDITDRRQVEVTLGEKEESLRITLQSIGDAIISTDTIGMVTRMNPVAEKLTGWDYAAAVGMPLTEVFNIINAETRESIDNPVKKVIETGEITGLANHTVLIAKDKSEYQIADSAAPVIDANGVITGVVLVFRDVTEEYWIKESLQRSEKQYRLLFESMIDGVCLHEIIYDNSLKAINYKILDANPKYEQILQLKKEDIIGKLATEIYQTDEAPYLDDYAKVAETGEPAQLEVFFQPMEKYFHISIYSPEKGKFATIFEDISERKQAVAELQESGEKYRTLFEKSSDAIFIYDPNTFNIIDANDATAKLYKYDRDELIGMSCLKFSSESAASKSTSEKARGDSVESIPFRHHKTKDEDELFVHLVVTKTTVDGKEMMFAVSKNVTEIKRQEEEIKQQLLEKEIILKESHHRIKNNFATIGSLLSLQADLLTNSEAISALKDATGRVNSMQVLYEKLLLTDNYLTASVKEYLETLFDEIISFFPGNLNLKVEKQISDFKLDPKTLVPIGIIVNELLTNVMKYAFKGRDSGLIKITLKEDAGEITLTIQDNGNGLPEGFDIDKQKGFGLMLIRMLSEQLNGSFTIENHIGTTSVIKFPI